MNLNCKPGDRALVWRNSTPMRCHCAAIGRVVTVETSCELQMSDGISTVALGAAWFYAGRPIPCSHGGPIFALLDADLVLLPPEDELRRDDAIAELQQLSREQVAAEGVR